MGSEPQTCLPNADGRRRLAFKKDLSGLINAFGLDNDANTPDYILADYLMDCFNVYRATKEANDRWHSSEPQPRPETEKQEKK